MDYIGSLGDFMELPSCKLFRTKEAPQSREEPIITRPANKHKSFSLDQHMKQYSNGTMAQTIKQKLKKTIKNRSQKRHKSTYGESVVKRMSATDHSFFVNKAAQPDDISRDKLTKRHLLLKSIVKTQDQQNKFRGSSIYDQSFRRLYNGLNKVHLQAIPNKEPLEINEEDDLSHIKRVNKTDFQKKKPSIPSKLRLRLENCRNWAAKHQKHTEYYTRELSGSKDQLVHVDPRIRRETIMTEIRQYIK